MDILHLTLALLLPVLLGSLWLALWVPAGSPGQHALTWGNGSLLGLLLIPLLMRVTDATGLVPGLATTGALAAVLITLSAVLHLRLKLSVGAVSPAQGTLSNPALNPAPSPNLAYRAIFVVILALLALRFATLGLELLWRPLFPWDATMHWATKARVWFESGHLVPFVEYYEWLRLEGRGVFTDNHPGYPITTPLLQLWINSALGRWDESLMNLPWLLCFAGLGAAFYGQARIAGATRLVSMIFTYLLLSMPLLNIHVALAGYADLFLGACYGAAIMAFHNWCVSRQHWQGVLALCFAAACPLIKNEGLYWLLTFLPALLVMLLPWRKAAALLLTLVFSLAVVLLIIPEDFSVAGHSLKILKPHFHPEAVGPFLTNAFGHDSWHLLAYLMAVITPLGLLLAGSRARNYRGIVTALACAIGLQLVLFLYTKYAIGAVRFTAIGRISIHIAPGLMFLAMLMFREISAAVAIKETPEHPAQPSS